MFIGIPQKESKSGFHPDLSVLIGHVVTEHVETRITESPFQVPFLLALQFKIISSLHPSLPTTVISSSLSEQHFRACPSTEKDGGIILHMVRLLRIQLETVSIIFLVFPVLLDRYSFFLLVDFCVI